MADNIEQNNDQQADSSETSHDNDSIEKDTKDFNKKQLEPFRNQTNPLLHVLHDAEIFNATIVAGAANEAPIKKALEKALSSEHELIKKTSIEIKFNKKDKDGNLFFDGLMIHASRVDAHGDVFSEINKIRDRYTESDGLNRVDIDHDLEFNKANIVEIYLVPKMHPLWDKNGKGKFVGSLAAKFKVTDIDTKERVMNGELDGISIFVSARLQDVATTKDKAKFYINKAINLLKTDNNNTIGELDMNQFEIIQKSLEDFIAKFSDEMKEMKTEVSKISEKLEKTEEKVEKTEEKVEKTEEKEEKISDFEKSVTTSVKELSEKVSTELNDIKEALKNLQLNKDSGDDSGQHEESAEIRPQYIKLNDEGDE